MNNCLENFHYKVYVNISLDDVQHENKIKKQKNGRTIEHKSVQKNLFEKAHTIRVDRHAKHTSNRSSSFLARFTLSRVPVLPTLSGGWIFVVKASKGGCPGWKSSVDADRPRLCEAGPQCFPPISPKQTVPL